MSKQRNALEDALLRSIDNPKRGQWDQLCQRAEPVETLDVQVRAIMDDVQKSGDAAVIDFTQRFDKVELTQTWITPQVTANMLPRKLMDAIRRAIANVRAFHASQLRDEPKVETSPGVVCWRKALPIEKVGLYIPGGTAPLFSSLIMLAVPALLAGCDELIVCTPPNKDGEVDPTLHFVACELGIKRLYTIGGAQAIAAMTFGTESVPRVDKLFGPGNSYVTSAKQEAQRHGVAIDMPAGPSELLVIADDSAPAAFVASDLLSQAEHGGDSQVLLVTTSSRLRDEVQREVATQLQRLPRKSIATKALGQSKIVLLPSTEDCMEFSNAYAPEHLIIATEDSPLLAQQVKHAGSVFIGPWTPESAGDYASGTNHTLPTNGFTRAYSGVSLDSFQRMVTFQEITPKGLADLGPVIESLAEAEGLEAHKNAVTLRLKALENV